jgi:C1A family cysteine protease
MLVYNHPAKLSDGTVKGTGWLPPPPDLRDYPPDHPDVVKHSETLGIPAGAITPGAALAPIPMPAAVDLRANCSPIEDQGNLGSCTANAAAGVVEYFEKRARGSYVNASRLFIYKTTRDLLQVTGDTGAWLRNVMGALALCGAPPETYWPYTTGPTWDDEPPAFVYRLADEYEALTYFRHDAPGRTAQDALNTVKLYLFAGVPSMFGFFGFPSFDHGDKPGHIPYPGAQEQAAWGHAIDAVGYDDNLSITNTQFNVTTKGALLIRNSWGTGWGDSGYGWMPYAYALNGLALDFWSLLSLDWVDSGQFGIPAIAPAAAVAGR